jgi:hypothetical protein
LPGIFQERYLQFDLKKTIQNSTRFIKYTQERFLRF